MNRRFFLAWMFAAGLLSGKLFAFLMKKLEPAPEPEGEKCYCGASSYVSALEHNNGCPAKLYFYGAPNHWGPGFPGERRLAYTVPSELDLGGFSLFEFGGPGTWHRVAFPRNGDLARDENGRVFCYCLDTWMVYLGSYDKNYVWHQATDQSKSYINYERNRLGQRVLT